MPRCDLRILLGLVVISALLALLDVGVGLSAGVMYLAPALLLLLPLLGGRYIGEEHLLRLGRTRPRRRALTSRRACAPRPRDRMLPRGGALIAAFLAVRPPPVARV